MAMSMRLTVQLPLMKSVTPLSERGIDDLAIDRIEHDHRVVLHPQCGGRIDPVAGPAGGAKPGVHLGRVVTALTRNECLGAHEGREIVRVLYRRGGLAEWPEPRPRTARSKRKLG